MFFHIIMIVYSILFLPNKKLFFMEYICCIKLYVNKVNIVRRLCVQKFTVSITVKFTRYRLSYYVTSILHHAFYVTYRTHSKNTIHSVLLYLSEIVNLMF